MSSDSVTYYTAGWNMPGYMPETQPEAFAAFTDADAYIRDELERAAEQLELAPAEVDAGDDWVSAELGNCVYWVEPHTDAIPDRDAIRDVNTAHAVRWVGDWLWVGACSAASFHVESPIPASNIADRVWRSSVADHVAGGVGTVILDACNLAALAGELALDELPVPVAVVEPWVHEGCVWFLHRVSVDYMAEHYWFDAERWVRDLAEQYPLADEELFSIAEMEYVTLAADANAPDWSVDLAEQFTADQLESLWRMAWQLDAQYRGIADVWVEPSDASDLAWVARTNQTIAEQMGPLAVVPDKFGTLWVGIGTDGRPLSHDPNQTSFPGV